MFSPDGRWISYDADDSGQWEVYVRPFPGTRFMLIQQGTLSEEGVANHVKFAFHWFGELERLLAATR